jgi:cobalt/nickel transport system permease protein
MHLPDGIVPAPICVAGATAALGLSAGCLRRFSDREIPKMALLAALYFSAGALHIRTGMGSVHLQLTGLLAVMLGWRAFVPVMLGVVMQAVLLAHGGIVTAGVNALLLGGPAVLVGALLARWTWPTGAEAAGLRGMLAALACGGLSLVAVWLLIMFFPAPAGAALTVWAGLQIPAILIEAVLTGMVVAYLHRVHPEVWRQCAVGS